MQKHVVYGSLASIGLFIIYLGILTAVESFEHALLQFAELWYLMLPLVMGFGVQIGLYFHIREGFKLAALSGSTGAVASSGGVSAGSMVLCCLHHVTDVLPIIGLSAAALFLTQFQPFFLVLGVFSNIVGITMMLNIMQKHNLQPKKGVFSSIFNYNMTDVRNGAFFSSAAILSVLLFSILLLNPTMASAPTVNLEPDIASSGAIDLQTVSKSANGVTIDVKPLDFGFGKNVIFEIGLTTHSGSLDFDVAEIAVLKDGNGNVYNPSGWDGSPPGGHHRSGELTFPPIQESGFMELTLMGIYDVPVRVFTWELGGS